MRASAHFLVSSKHDQFPHHCNFFLILLAFDLTPWHTSSAIRVMCTFHRNLCSVVNTRTSRKCEENCKLLIEFIQIMKTVHKSLCIVGIQQIEEYIVILLHIHSITTIYHIFKFLFFHRFI